MNSIIILFITDIDEKFYKLIRVLKKDWVDKLKAQQNAQAAGTNESAMKTRSKDSEALQDEVNSLEKRIARLEKLLSGQNKGGPEIGDIPQDQDLIGAGSDSARSCKSYQVERDGESSESISGSSSSSQSGVSRGGRRHKRRGRRNLRIT